MIPEAYRLSTYSYELPEGRIAQTPASPRDSSRLLTYDRSNGSVAHEHFSDFPDLLDGNELLVFNDVRVIPSRMVLEGVDIAHPRRKPRTETVEIFFLRSFSDTRFEAMVYPGDYFPVDATCMFGNYRFAVREITYEGRIFEVLSGGTAFSMMQDFGRLPLPPYIEYSKEKETSYQTVFARNEGALAAPTASLHFTSQVMERIVARGCSSEFLTLYVGLGTFKSIYEEDIRDFAMHSEYMSFPVELYESIARAKAESRPIIAVGTTVVRTLESMSSIRVSLGESLVLSEEAEKFWHSIPANPEWISDAKIGEPTAIITAATKIFLHPPEAEFAIVDRLVTNFHLPQSTLLMLVCSFIGTSAVLYLYALAVREGYRFFSFGDAMYVK